ncbi:MAG: DUF4112 domain-containing protein [Candidatus Hydrogenedentota bacterium]
MDAEKRKSIIRQLEHLSRLMDASIGIPGTKFKFGIDAVIGLIPGGGDLIGVVISLYVVARAAQLGIPKSTIVRMLGNVASDGLIGSVPVAGDVFDAFFKANQRNVKLTLDALSESELKIEDKAE